MSRKIIGIPRQFILFPRMQRIYRYSSASGKAICLLILCIPMVAAFWTQSVYASGGEYQLVANNPYPTYWYLLTAALSLLVPAGFVLVSIAGLDVRLAWDAALGSLGALGLAALGYWAFGFGFQFGGVGLVFTEPELQPLIWEWSALSAAWGRDWGMAGLSGWFLSGPDVTPLMYTLFLAHLPWAITAALLPIIALRGRAPTLAILFLALLIGGVIYPVAGNWVQGGGWLSALGRNLNLGHGLIDFGGAGSVHLVTGSFALAALVVWVPKRPRQPLAEAELPPVQVPLLAVVGSIFILAGLIGWSWSNPLQVRTLNELALMRGSVNCILFAGGAVLTPLLYTWFVTGKSDPLMSARGLAAGAVAGLAMGPFVQPGVAFFIGLLVGTTIPFVTFVVNYVLRLDDATGVIHVSAVPGLLGLLFAGIWADGIVGSGWQMTGIESHLGVTRQGVSGLFVAAGYQPDFPAQLQAQLVGILSLGLWGFLSGMLICTPLSLLSHGLQQSNARRIAASPHPPLPGPSVPQPTLSQRNIPGQGPRRRNALQPAFPHRRYPEQTFPEQEATQRNPTVQSDMNFEVNPFDTELPQMGESERDKNRDG